MSRLNQKWFITASLVLTALLLLAPALNTLTGGRASAVSEYGGALKFAAESGAPSPTPAPPEANYASEHMKIFREAGNVIKIYGIEGSQGVFAGEIKIGKTSLPTEAGSATRLDGERGWYTLVYYLGNKVYQINLYNPAGTLQDDRYRFTVD